MTAIPPETDPNPAADLAVVGAGPAGLMAATVAAEAGARVVVVERSDRVGGLLGLQVQALQGPRSMYRGRNGVELCRHLLETATSAGVLVVRGAAVSTIKTGALGGDRPSFRLFLGPPGGDSELTAEAVILATGSREPRPRFPGADLPGVLLCSEIQEMANLGGRLPGERALVVGSDNAGLLVAADLLAAGAEVLAIVEREPAIVGRRVNIAQLREAGVAILTSTTVLAAEGATRVESATIARLGRDGAAVQGTERSLDVDTICLAEARIPRAQLAAAMGCPTLELAALGGPVPVHDRLSATPVAGVYVCGDGAGVESGAAALETGRLAGLSAAASLGLAHPGADAQARLARRRLAFLRRGGRGRQRREAKRLLAAEARRLARGG